MGGWILLLVTNEIDLDLNVNKLSYIMFSPRNLMFTMTEKILSASYSPIEHYTIYYEHKK